jgi:hypothetical protein
MVPQDGVQRAATDEFNAFIWLRAVSHDIAQTQQWNVAGVLDDGFEGVEVCVNVRYDCVPHAPIISGIERGFAAIVGKQRVESSARVITNEVSAIGATDAWQLLTSARGYFRDRI